MTKTICIERIARDIMIITDVIRYLLDKRQLPENRFYKNVSALLLIHRKEKRDDLLN